MADGEGVVTSGNQRGESRMSSERWKKVEALFEQTLEAAPAARPEFLQAIDDAEVRREVESLLEAHGEAGVFLDEPDRFFSSESFDVDTLSPGQVIDRYRIIRELGRGGMGAVFLAERADDEYKKQVALKLIKRGADTDAVLRHFRNERQILAGFDHPNIARLFDGGTTETGLPYFVMEYVDGLPIDEYCHSNALSIAERLKLFREVCAAVSYAHRRLVIHRDIKRSNILVTAEGVPKLLDFGIAKLLQEEDTPRATMTALHLMTPQSASPEQLRGQPVTTATDVYSLGVVLYELLCGQSPYQFGSQAPHEMAREITATEPRKPSSAAADASFNAKLLKGDLDNVVLMALRKEPERRYQSVDQFSEDIRRHLEDLPVLARRDTLGYRTAKFARRNKAGLAVAAVVLLILIGGIVATSRQARIANREKTRAERRFNDVRKLANSVLFDYHDAIKALPGATKVRERLVKDALTYLDSLAAEAHDDPVLQQELAAAYERVGDVRGGASGGSLGDLAGAIESYTKALQIREALVATNSSDRQARRDLAGTEKKIGDSLSVTSKPGDGVDYLRKALALDLDLSKAQPRDDDLQVELADIHTALGHALVWRGDLADALEHYRATIAIAETLTGKHPQGPRDRRVLWNANRGIADVLFLKADLPGAIETNKKALALGETLVAENPDNADYRRALIDNYKQSAEYRAERDEPGALDDFRKALVLEEQLVAADPANVVTRRDLAYLHKRIGECSADLNDNSQALEHFRKAAEIFDKVRADAPADLPSRFRAATCRAGAAGMQARLGQIDSALQECRKAEALFAEITEDPTNNQHRSLRAQGYEFVAYAYEALAAVPGTSAADARQRTSAARKMFQQAVEVLNDLRARGILGEADEQWAKSIAGEMAKCDQALGN
jgi:tetratricopeptide (TPR) repeat protein